MPEYPVDGAGPHTITHGQGQIVSVAVADRKGDRRYASVVMDENEATVRIGEFNEDGTWKEAPAGRYVITVNKPKG